MLGKDKVIARAMHEMFSMFHPHTKFNQFSRICDFLGHLLCKANLLTVAKMSSLTARYSLIILEIEEVSILANLFDH